MNWSSAARHVRASLVGRPFAFHRRPATGFTLLELLAVIAIIALLTGIVIGVGRRASESGKIARAKAELAILSAALESYKRQYGDYPQAGTANNALTTAPAQLNDANVRLFHALTGVLGPTLRQLSGGKAWIELARFTVEEGEFSQQVMDGALSPNALLDPWGNRYVYYYRTAGVSTWSAPSYVLYSVGPDGAKPAATESTCHAPPASTGAVDYNDDRNLDNIYANR